MDEQAAALAEGVEAAVPGWVERSVEKVMTAYAGEAAPAVRAAAADAGFRAREAVGKEMRALLEADIDEQRTTPLSIIRDAVRFPTAVLREAGVPPVVRDSFSEVAFPDDIYDLSPATLADLDPALVDLGLAWGAAKAMAHRRRHMGGPV